MHLQNIRRLFLCEFITAGGLNHIDLPLGLAKEGALMRDALLRDLAELPIEISTTVDARLSQPKVNGVCLSVDNKSSVQEVWREMFLQHQVSIIIAPESEGALYQLTQLAEVSGSMVLGCNAEMVALFGDKMQTFSALSGHGVPTIPSFLPEEVADLPEQIYLTKPIDGVGCMDTRLHQNRRALMKWLQAVMHENVLIQPYVDGEHGSVSCLMQSGRAHILSCNRQMITRDADMLIFGGCIVNGWQQYWQPLTMLAQSIASAFPQLKGYVGIDVIKQGDDWLVVEINPRITTSYAGLRKATGRNVTAMLIESMTNPDFSLPEFTRHEVMIHV